jgi:hypothetical protein
MSDYDNNNEIESPRSKKERQWITAAGVSFFGFQAIFQLVLCAHLLSKVWPVDGKITNDVDQLIFVLIAGAFGGSVGVISDYRKWMFRAFKPENLDMSRAFQGFWAYLVRIFQGAGAALAFYVALRAGLIALVDTNLAVGLNPWGTAGISVLAGMFGGLAVDRLWSSAQSLVGK